MHHRTWHASMLLSLSTLLLISCATLSQGHAPPDNAYSLNLADIPPAMRASLQKWQENPVRITGSLAHDPISQEHKAALNKIRTTYYREKESPFYHATIEDATRFRSLFGLGESNPNWPQGHPKVCLAMSGGGIRSASFNIGVLQGIAEKGAKHLETIDVASSVSGGSYVNGWLNAHSILDKASHRQVLSNPDNIAYLENNSKDFVNKPLSAVMALINYIWMQPLLWIANTAARQPEIDISGIAYYVDLNLFLKNDARDGIQRIPFRDLANHVAVSRSPFPIFNGTYHTTADACTSKALSPYTNLDNRVFEMTPLRMGTESIGFGAPFIEDPFLDLTGVMMVSGAALDRATDSTCSLRRLTGLRTGITFRGLTTTSGVLDASNSNRDNQFRTRNVHIADGGFSDNSGVYPLVKRLCETILVVDAEHDPDLDFASYKTLKTFLRESVGLDYAVDAIDTQKCIGAPDEFAADNYKCPLTLGKISSIPYDNGPDLELDVIYLKLSMDASGSYPAEIVQFIKSQGRTPCKRKGLNDKCPFPQQSTTHQSFSAEEFRAYRLLGRYFVNELKSIPYISTE